MPAEVRTYERADAKQTWETYLRAIHDTASQDYLEQWHQRRIAANTFVGLFRLHTHASRTARPALERFRFVVDRANPDNAIRGRRIPNFDMHRDLS